MRWANDYIKVFLFFIPSFMHGPVLVEGRAYVGIESERKIEGESYI